RMGWAFGQLIDARATAPTAAASIIAPGPKSSSETISPTNDIRIVALPTDDLASDPAHTPTAQTAAKNAATSPGCASGAHGTNPSAQRPAAVTAPTAVTRAAERARFCIRASRTACAAHQSTRFEGAKLGPPWRAEEVVVA